MTLDDAHTKYAVVAFTGASIWHLFLFVIRQCKLVSPWARANGGLIRGVRDFFWTVKPQPPQPQTKPQ